MATRLIKRHGIKWIVTTPTDKSETIVFDTMKFLGIQKIKNNNNELQTGVKQI